MANSMIRALKWIAGIVVSLAVVAFLAFLYFIPPFFSVSPEDYVTNTAAPVASLDDITDPAERAIAERGRYIVMTTGCADCHSTPGPQGPRADMYLAGGMKLGAKDAGIAVSRNLTPDAETGLAHVSDADVKRVLRSGVFHDGRQVNHRQMPWNAFSNWTEEDRHAVLTYLRHIKVVTHQIPNPDRSATFDDADALDHFFNQDFGTVPASAP